MKSAPPTEVIRFETLSKGGQRLSAQIWLPAKQETVFAFFSDAHQLEALTPPRLKFRMVTQPPIVLARGTRIDYRLRIYGLPLRWQSEISLWEPPVRFVDRQLVGPYRQWEHEHRFATIDNGTLVSDCVDYRVPGGVLIDRLLVRRDLRQIFTYRLERLREIFGGS